MSTLTVSLIQTDLYWEDKSRNLAMLEEKIREIKAPQVVVLPEMFSTGFSMQPELLAEGMDGYTVQWMKNIAAECRIILCGSLMIQEDGKYYNRLLWVLPNGQVGHYDKRHLFGHGMEDQHYTAGNSRCIVSVNGWRINLQICYDLRFPVWARQQLDDHGEAEYDILLYVANWPERRNHAWKTLLQARAIENQCYVIGVNRVGEDDNEIYHSGDSMIAGPLGEVIFSSAHKELVFTTTLHKEPLVTLRQQLPFLKDADPFSLL
jgi:predicted amidohydrolase